MKLLFDQNISFRITKIVWIRTGNLTTKEIAALLKNNQKTIKSFLSSNEFQNNSCLELG
jgi:predicted nuclease of predicted toxin-antitoxin system